ncbi:MAG: pilin [bacterium]|nr:pilin [bacterium]
MKRIKSFILISLFLFMVVIGLNSGSVSAQSTREACEAAGRTWMERGPASECTGSAPQAAGACTPRGSILGFPTWYKYLDAEQLGGRCTPIINNSTDVLPIGIAVLEAMLRAAGILAAVFILWGGVKLMISQGEPDGAKAARLIIKNAIIGLILVLIATPLVSFIGNRISAS